MNTLTPESLAAFVKATGDGVSFVEIERAFPAACGEYELAIDGHNIVLWRGVSMLFVDTLAEALRRGLVEYTPTSPLVYYADGKVLRLPLAKRAKRYKTPRWAPVVLNIPDFGNDAA